MEAISKVYSTMQTLNGGSLDEIKYQPYKQALFEEIIKVADQNPDHSFENNEMILLRGRRVRVFLKEFLLS